jgi:ribonuclease HII
VQRLAEASASQECFRPAGAVHARQVVFFFALAAGGRRGVSGASMIIDPRFDELAAGLTGYSTSLKKGERVLIDAFDVPDAMVIALIRAARARGAFPYVQLHRARVTREMMLGAQDECYIQFSKDAPLRLDERYTIYNVSREVKHPTSRKKIGHIVEILGEVEIRAITDGNIARGFDIPTATIIGGDGRSVSIAAASVLAKVTRDRYCVELDEIYPGYGFASHKGYPTREHYEAIRRLGAISGVHRNSFRLYDEGKNAFDA